MDERERISSPGTEPRPSELPITEGDERFLDRQASELAYHARVLAKSRDATRPLLDRVRFLAIFTDLTDEFFRVRVAGLKEQRRAGIRQRSRTGKTPAEQIQVLHERFRDLVKDQRRILDEELLPELASHGIRLVAWEHLAECERRELDEIFEREIFPVLTPLAFGPAHPFPFISDLSLSIGVCLDDDGVSSFARVKVPALLDRFVQLERDDDELVMIPIEEVIGAHLGRLFPGRRVESWHTFRVTRNADYEVEDVDVADLLDAVANEIIGRRFGRVVRLELDDAVPERILELLMEELEITRDDVYIHARPLALNALNEVANLDRPELSAPSWKPMEVLDFEREDVFAVLRDRDVLVHHPYDSFASSTQRFIEQAAKDPRVLAIKQTLYRTSGDSPVVKALIRAAESGKQVAALVELKARFDEEANIAWAEQLEEAGVHVVYGFVELKTHTKTLLIVRRDEDGTIRRYGHIATGNYNPTTAKFYEDVGLFTADPSLTSDLGQLFNMLTGHSRTADYQRLLVAPVTLVDRVIELIRAQAHPEGRIVVKVNNLSHNGVIDALYAASQAGAQIDLIVRTICCLRPGVPGLSENIRVRSIVGDFLEHSRICRFGHDPEPGAYLIGSADWMTRNLENRVEAVAPVDDPRLRERLDDILDGCLEDDVLAWQLGPDGTWSKIATEESFNVQTYLRAQAERRRRGV